MVHVSQHQTTSLACVVRISPVLDVKARFLYAPPILVPTPPLVLTHPETSIVCALQDTPARLVKLSSTFAILTFARTMPSAYLLSTVSNVYALQVLQALVATLKLTLVTVSHVLIQLLAPLLLQPPIILTNAYVLTPTRD
jgi:hypothetical protein